MGNKQQTQGEDYQYVKQTNFICNVNDCGHYNLRVFS